LIGAAALILVAITFGSYLLWKLEDVFAIQSEIAKTIPDQLQAKLSPHEETAIEQAPTPDAGQDGG
jgi:hypothetical protein